MDDKQLLSFFKEKRNDFPILKQKINNKNLVYVDNGATTQKPQCMIESITQYYTKYNSNIHRGIHTLSEKSTQLFEESRQKTAQFLNANFNEIIFTSGATQAINSIVISLWDTIKEGDEIVLTEAEHHANLVPWQELAYKKNLKLKFIPFNENFELDMNKAKELITEKTKILSFPHVSNLLGTTLPAKELISLTKTKTKSTITIIDASQSAPHMKLDVKELGCDFMVFSAHKMCGPTGVGVIYGKYETLEKVNPFIFGGNMIEKVELEKSTYGKIPFKFESGTANIADVIAFKTTLDYLEDIGMDNIESYEKILTKHFLERINEIKGFNLIGPKNTQNRSAVFSFTIDNISSYDLSVLLDKKGIAVRSGHHCVQPFHTKMNINSSTRVSLYFYNTIEEIDYIIDTLKLIVERFC